ncbi:MAG: alkaline phosphatase [Prevotellaceae bacterium]|jgi:alkaline phosphatase|nr:alkaline phosphatase [Prevotellaceae bacterium]
MNNRIKQLTTLLIIGLCTCGCAQNTNHAKYVFYFIGDGMGLSHISLTEAYLAANNGEIGNTPLNFTQFPVIGLSSTYSIGNFITESSAAGTALSTGEKTTNSALGVRPDSTHLRSISYMIHDAGYSIGIVSNVSIDHATPAAFYACSPSRSDYYGIALQLPLTGFEFFGGGGFIRPSGRDKDQPSVYESITDAGYAIARGVGSYQLVKEGASKMFYTQDEGVEGDLPYAIDRTENSLTLPLVVEAAIDFLYNPKGKGFFLMSEGGKIDWAAHSNDAKTTILEVLDFADAINLAITFYNQHPNETLIVVTADHETGGLALGAKNGYNLFFDVLKTQTTSVDTDKSIAQAVTLSNQEARIGWTTTSHTGVSVPIFAIGVGSEKFSGQMDNTDIPKKICAAMGISFNQQ